MSCRSTLTLKVRRSNELGEVLHSIPQLWLIHSICSKLLNSITFLSSNSYQTCDMLWKCGISTSKRSRRVLETRALSPFCLLSTSSRSRRPPTVSKFALERHTVFTTLMNCNSDIIALSFFLWCGRQPYYSHDLLAIDHMAGVLTRLTEKLRTVKQLVYELVNVGCAHKPQTFHFLMRISWRGRMHGLVLEVFEEMIEFGYEPNTFSFNVVMDVFFKTGHCFLALQIMNDMVSRNFLTLSIAVCNLCRLDDSANMERVLKLMLDAGYYLDTRTFTMVLHYFCKNGWVSKAFQMLSILIVMGIPISVKVWSILINGLCKMGKHFTALCLLEKMIMSGFSPNVATYTPLLKSFMDLKMFSSASDILSMMDSNECTLDIVFYNMLIHCLSNMGRYNDAISLFHHLLRLEMLPDCYTFSSILSVICMSRRFYLWPRFLRNVVLQTDLVVCNLLMHYFCEAGYPLSAVDMYNDMLDNGYKPDKYTFVGLLKALYMAGLVADAVSVYRGIIMTFSHLDAHFHTIILHHLIKDGKTRIATSLFWDSIIKKHDLDSVLFVIAITGFLRGGRANEAHIFYLQMKQCGFLLNKNMFNKMVCCSCIENNAEMVGLLLDDMIKSGTELNHDTLKRVCNFFLTK